MNTFLKIAIGFVLGIICTIVGLYVIGMTQNTEENQLKEDIRISALRELKNILDNPEPEIVIEEEVEKKNIQFFELSTKKGVVKLHTYMSKDSVQILMGYPQSTDVDVWDFNDEVHETWEYKVKSGYGYELTFTTIKFVNGELVSVNQY
jgi:hypothetical protein